MLDLILIILLIVSLAKPDVLLSKQMREKANDEQKAKLAKNYRKVYSVVIALFESTALISRSDTEVIGVVIGVICIILAFTMSWPAAKENKEITKELKDKEL